LDVNNRQLAEWLMACTLSDKRAFARLYTATSPKLYGILVALLKNRTDADEALQETYLNIWKNAASYNPERGEPMAWMSNIARFRALDLLRKQTTRRRYEDDYQQTVSHDDRQLLAIDEHSDGGVLENCIQRLQEQARRCVIMAYCEGYTHEELSHKLDAPIGTVKSWVRRSLKRLRECIHELSAP